MARHRDDWGFIHNRYDVWRRRNPYIDSGWEQFLHRSGAAFAFAGDQLFAVRYPPGTVRYSDAANGPAIAGHTLERFRRLLRPIAARRGVTPSRLRVGLSSATLRGPEAILLTMRAPMRLDLEVSLLVTVGLSATVAAQSDVQAALSVPVTLSATIDGGASPGASLTT